MAVKFLDSITVDGSIGIGTTSPGAVLDSDSNTNWSAAWRNNLRLTSDLYPCMRLYSQTINKTSFIGNNNDGGLWFYVGGTGNTATGGQYAMTMLSTGNVGVGILSPAAKLDVLQEARISFAAGHQYRVRITNTDGNGRILVDGDTSSLIFGTSPAGTNATATEKMRITSGGNVGIGTTNPGYKLTVTGTIISTAASNPQLILQDTTHSNITIKGDSGIFSVTNQGVGQNITMLYSGNVGIGTTVPQDKLHVVGHLRVASTSPIIKLDETDRANENWAIINSGGVMTFRTSNSAFSSYNTKISINQTGSIEFNSYTASATAAGITAINPNQNFYPSGTGSDTTTDLAVDQEGNVVRTTQEATWKLTRAQVNAITTSAAGTTLLSAPGSSNLFIIIEKVTFLILFSNNGNKMSATQQYQILQDGNVADEIAVINGNRVNDIAFAGGNTNTSGIYEHDTGYSTLNRTYKPNTATTIRRVNTGALNTSITNMLIKIRYRVYDTATF